MEIRNNNPINSRPQEAHTFDPTGPTREAIDKFTPEPVSEVASKDEVKVSRAAQEALAREERVEVRTQDQQQRIDDLKALHSRGDLNTPERVEEAAAKMLVEE
jgi:hypothetical protein